MKQENIEQVFNIPMELRQSGQFCMWKYETVDGRKTKVPYNPKRPQSKAATNRPETFSTFSEAISAARDSDFDGIGIRVSGDFIGIDIDHVETDTDGRLTGTARDICVLLRAYTELSPSGHGLRIFCKASDLNFDKLKYYIKHDNLEIYVPGMTNRFLTVTGNTISKEDMLVERTDELQAILDKYMTRPQKQSQTASERVSEPLTLTEEEIVSKAKNARNGKKFSNLFSGNYQSDYSSQSEADLALCTMLAFWCNRDTAMIDSIFCKSGLYRDKWNREDYKQETLSKAISATTETYSPPKKTIDSVDSFSAATSDTVTVSPITEQETVPDPTDSDAPSRPEKEQTPPPPPEPSSSDIFKEFLSEIKSDRFEPISTGIDTLDKALSGGFERKTLVTVAAAPGAGKTAICQYILENMAWKGHPVVYVNLEMDRSQLLSRSISRLSHQCKINHTISEDMTALQVKRGYEWTDSQKETMRYVSKLYQDYIAPNFRYVTTNPENLGSIDNTLSDILSKLEKITKELQEQGQQAPLVCIDYLQFIEYDLEERKPDNAEAIKQTLKAFKSFAMKYNTVVLMITANNRASNAEGKASMDSGRDTSNIEYSGDVMLSLVYTAVEESWLHKSGKHDKNGNDIPKVIDNDFINYVIDYSVSKKEEYPMIAKLVSLKVVKGRSIQSRRSAKFVYDGRYFYFEQDNGTFKNPYWHEDIEDPE